MRGKGKGSWGLSSKLEFPTVFLLCSVFFLAGIFGTMILSRDIRDQSRTRRLQEAFDEFSEDFTTMPHGETGDSSIDTIPFQVLSWKPRALYFPKFATKEQCQHVIKIAQSSLVPSSLAFREGETKENTKGIRTSSGTFVSASEDKSGILDLIEEKIAKVTMLPRTHGEAFNILRYEIGQRYHSHFDAFNPAEYGPQKSQRVASFLLYLSDVEGGGETMFPFENGLNVHSEYDYKKCVGLKVKPQLGDGLLFYSVYPNGTIDQVSLFRFCLSVLDEQFYVTNCIFTY
ncbi:hypothetical protein AMTRI_Chr12g235450 [Amborella trichopoda]